MNRKKVDIITMGCSKNLVDSEQLMGLFEANGYTCTHDSENPDGEIVVVNTCGFIADAKEESINIILEFAQAKEEGRIEKLYVMGCLSERYLADLEKEIPEVDGWYGKFNYKQLLNDLQENQISDNNQYLRHITTPSHYAYLKISEGCDRHCAYCAIPIITGKHQSRPMDEILDEVRFLVEKGVKEFQVIAQELTYYGVDLYGEQRIAELVERMADIKGVEWIRLHYAYPTHFPWDLLRVMREKKNVCNYLDIALQHISDHMLTRMRRNVSKAETMALIERLRKEVPGIHIRTTLMVGFPGETEDDFQQLVDFTKWARFERMGAFAYSEEDGTYSANHYEDDVPDDVKQQRLDRLMRVQQNISAELEAEKVGQVLRVIIDRLEGDYFVGRTEYCSPEVDPEVLIRAEKPLEIGSFYKVKITDSEEFDLYGIVVEKEM
ncbi:30S ribosomal protein S12 methylthiotransferase RimO [Prevotella sp. E9-3]|uniref:30S ribosomal protein S12 methylthiotransferase RimO n=1 Tax=Prevotella sp. E9-3 TaxID=2913621 RepID=UPI001EDA612D|nr:30S ribosomal protein S12 methylthiotransferase RimO [Prevotella sp. E9-3]UKK47199.1 30S ribosomal protein S12 methylthiotransferase RimO [Prevotella sp. E9-3]